MEVGAIQVPINPKSTAAEVAGFVQQVRPALIVTDRDLAPTVDAAIDGSGLVEPAGRRRASCTARSPTGAGPHRSTRPTSR